MIFVHIAAYRDPELEPTLDDLFAKATRPAELRVVVVHQRSPDDPASVQRRQVHTLTVDYRDTRGACWARHLGHKLWDGEDYVLQLDSHMRFVQGWDDRMLVELAACPSPKALLTTYPPNYEPPNHIAGTSPTYIGAHRFDTRGYLEQRPLIWAPQTAPQPTALLSANFIFGPARCLQEVEYDRWLYFHGEEPTLAVRFWTSGWDMYGPSIPVCWHRYGRDGRTTHWADDPEWWKLDQYSMARMKHLFEMDVSIDPDVLVDLDRYGLGTARTLAAYQAWSGIDFKNRTLNNDCQIGRFPAP